MKDITVPLHLISILADGEFHSGEQLGTAMGMSRAAINKHIQTVRDWGVDIFTVPGKGYSLPHPIQLLDEATIISMLPAGRVSVLPVIDSTNQYLLDRISELSSGDACVAEYQQAGRGRRGRKWFSPFGSNLYLSMYWKLDQGPAAAMGLSLVIGIVMAEVLQRLGAEDVRVKWPNDLYLKDRKLAGILVELTGKTGDAAQLVIGAGINLKMREPVALKLRIFNDQSEQFDDVDQLPLDAVGPPLNAGQGQQRFNQGVHAHRLALDALDHFFTPRVLMQQPDRHLHARQR